MTSQSREIGYSALVQTGPKYHFVESWSAERRQLNQRNFLRGVTEELNTVQTSIYDTYATIAMPVLVNKKTKHSYERKCSLYSYRIYDNRMRCSDVISQSPFPIQILYLGNVSLLKTKQYMKLLFSMYYMNEKMKCLFNRLSIWLNKMMKCQRISTRWINSNRHTSIPDSFATPNGQCQSATLNNRFLYQLLWYSNTESFWIHIQYTQHMSQYIHIFLLYIVLLWPCYDRFRFIFTVPGAMKSTHAVSTKISCCQNVMLSLAFKFIISKNCVNSTILNCKGLERQHLFSS